MILWTGCRRKVTGVRERFRRCYRGWKKGALYHEKEGRIFVYSPAVPKESYLQKERGTFLHRFFDGALNQMMVSFLNDNDLSDSDLDELQAILNEKREKKRR